LGDETYVTILFKRLSFYDRIFKYESIDMYPGIS
jgi:hypothetical protein